ncbi:MAG: hypothetical protein ACHQTF_11335, partial [Gemmatimonadales bacterium]
PPSQAPVLPPAAGSVMAAPQGGVALAASYAAIYGGLDGPRLVWGVVAWLAAGALAAGRQLGGWRARRAAVAATVAFAVVVASYVAARLVEARPGHFL